VVIGDGPELPRLRARAGANVSLVGYQEAGALRDYLQRARAFLYAAQEDFGIVMAEAQAAGAPVIAYGRGGAAEIVADLDTALPTGVLFAEQTAAAAAQAIATFEREASRITPEACRAGASRFGIERFRQEMRQFVDTEWRSFAAGALPPALDEPPAAEPPPGAILFDPQSADRPRRAA
jgi:glycosyltransferase involved in cell wall biosynthesis